MENGDPSSGTIRLEVDNVSTLADAGKSSDAVEVEGLPWRLQVSKTMNDTKPYLAAFLKYKLCKSNLWSFEASCTFRLIGNQKALARTRKNSFNKDSVFMSAFMISWDDLMDETKGFVHDDKMIIEVSLSVKNIIGIRKVPRIDFSDKDEPRHDIALEVGGENIYVNKTYLALHSPFFDRLFFGDFAEKRQKVVELKDVDPKEFKELLTVIYPTQQKITDMNYKYLVALGDRYEMKIVLDKVEDFLISSVKLTTGEKLLLYDQYRLVKLHDHCLNSIVAVFQITALKFEDQYKKLSEKTRLALFDRMMEISP